MSADPWLPIAGLVGTMLWWLGLTAATAVVGLRRTRLRSPGGRWAAAGGLLGAAVPVMWLGYSAVIYASFAAGGNWMPGEVVDAAFGVAFTGCWLGSQATVVVAAARIWRRLERGPKPGGER